MKNENAIKKNVYSSSLAMVGLVLASAGAQAALPKITVTGVIGNSVTTQDVALQHDPSPWFGKAYTLEMTIDAEGVIGDQETDPIVPGLVLNHWLPNKLDYRLMIDGALVSSGSDTQWADVETINDFTVPAGLTDLPSGIQVGHTYDSLYISMDGALQFGCLDGACDSPTDTYELLRMTFQNFWDMAQGDAITNNNLPNFLSGTPDLTQGFGFVTIDFEQWSQATGSLSAGYIDSSISNVTVAAAPVPEPETWAMLLAGLGLVGFAVRRRAAR